MNFLFITCGYPPEKTAGAENGLQRLGAALVERGHGVTVAAIKYDQSLPDEMDHGDGVRVLRKIKPLALGPLWGISLRKQVSKILNDKSINWDFVLCNQLYLYSDLAARVAEKKGRHSSNLVVNAHDFSDFKMLAQERRGQKIMDTVKQYSSVFVLSQQSAKEAVGYGFQPSQIFNYRYFLDDPGLVNRKAHESKTLLFIGRFSEQKNTEVLLRSFLEYVERGGKLNLKMVGEGDKKEMLMSMLRESLHAHKVSIYPWSSDPQEHYRDCRAVVTATHAEGLSNVMVEALAHGRPILWTDVSGARDAVDPENKVSVPLEQDIATEASGGLLIPRDDVEALVNGFQKLEDEDFVKKQSELARKSFEHGFTKDKSVERFMTEVERIKSGSKKVSPYFEGVL